jgi:hypothetical protein
MSKLSRLAVLVVGLMSLFGVLSSSAGATTWDNSGATAFTASSGPGTLSATDVVLSCSGSTATGTAPATAIGLTYSVSGTATFNGCKMSNITTVVDCAYTLTGTTQHGTGMGSIITGSVGVTCDVAQFGTKVCHIEGSVPGSYVNSTPGVLNIATAASGLTLTNPPVGSCPLGNGDAGHLTPLSYTVESPGGSPTITKTG